MRTNNDKIYSELSYKDRLALDFKENSMLYRFYLWLYQKEQKKKIEEQKLGNVKPFIREKEGFHDKYTENKENV